MKPAFNKILQANASNYTRTPDIDEIRYINERPMMLSMWTQTYREDFAFLKELDPIECNSGKSNETSEIERALLEKIRGLEKTLNAQSELLEQIHATSSRKSSVLVQSEANQGEDQDKSIHEQSLHSYQYDGNSHKEDAEDNDGFRTRRESPSSSQTDATASSVINTISQIQSVTESIKYTIIAEGNDSEPDLPIEIQITADEDANGTLNTSAESGRLEICLSDDLPTETSTRHDERKFNMVSPDNSDAHLPLKRRRIDNHNKIVKCLKQEEKYIPYTVPLMEQQPKQNESKMKIDLDNVMMSIGPNNTRIPAKVYENMNWKSASIATRKLLMAVFDRQTLATHSMTGKPSPAFKNQKPMKQMLNPNVIQDIIFAVTRKCNVSDKQVRNAITTKCADENKMMKLQLCKQERNNSTNDSLRESNKEN